MGLVDIENKGTRALATAASIRGNHPDRQVPKLPTLAPVVLNRAVEHLRT